MIAGLALMGLALADATLVTLNIRAHRRHDHLRAMKLAIALAALQVPSVVVAGLGIDQLVVGLCLIGLQLALYFAAVVNAMAERRAHYREMRRV